MKLRREETSNAGNFHRSGHITKEIGRRDGRSRSFDTSVQTPTSRGGYLLSRASISPDTDDTGWRRRDGTSGPALTEPSSGRPTRNRQRSHAACSHQAAASHRQARGRTGRPGPFGRVSLHLSVKFLFQRAPVPGWSASLVPSPSGALGCGSLVGTQRAAVKKLGSLLDSPSHQPLPDS